MIPSFKVGNGDMFYIKHGSNNFTTIDNSIIWHNDNSRSFCLVLLRWLGHVLNLLQVDDFLDPRNLLFYHFDDN